jgi:hypothetical protein
MKRNSRHAEPAPTNYARQARLAKRERINNLLADLRQNRPWWANEPPWIAERILEYGGNNVQRELFSVEGEQ